MLLVRGIGAIGGIGEMGGKKELRARPSLVLAASLLGFVAGLIHPSSLIVVYGIWGLLTFYYLVKLLIQRYTLRRPLSKRFSSVILNLIQNLYRFQVPPAAHNAQHFRAGKPGMTRRRESSLSDALKYLGWSLFFFVFSFLSLLYIRRATSTLAWSGIARFAQTRWVWSIKDFCLGLGASLFLGIGGLVLALKEKKFYPLIAWVLTVPLGMAFLKISGILDMSYFFQVGVHLPLAILTTYFLKKTGKRAFGFLAILFLFLSLPVIVKSFKNQIRFINERVVAGQPLVPYPSQVMYPLQDFWNSIKWLDENTKDDEVIFSEETAGNYIPAYAGNFVYLGHNAETVDFDKKKTVVSQFFSQILTPDEAMAVLKKNRVGYVFYGPQEKEKGVFDVSKYSFLKPVFESYHVTIYRVEKY